MHNQRMGSLVSSAQLTVDGEIARTPYNDWMGAKRLFDQAGRSGL